MTSCISSSNRCCYGNIVLPYCGSCLKSHVDVPNTLVSWRCSVSEGLLKKVLHSTLSAVYFWFLLSVWWCHLACLSRTPAFIILWLSVYMSVYMSVCVCVCVCVCVVCMCICMHSCNWKILYYYHWRQNHASILQHTIGSGVSLLVELVWNQHASIPQGEMQVS